MVTVGARLTAGGGGTLVEGEALDGADGADDPQDAPKTVVANSNIKIRSCIVKSSAPAGAFYPAAEPSCEPDSEALSHS